MEESVSKEKNQKLVKILAWVLIIIAGLALIKNIFVLQGLYHIVTIKGIIKNYNPPLELDISPYIISHIIEILLCIIIFTSATYILKYKQVWRQILIYGLIASIIYLIAIPLINYYYPTFISLISPDDAQKELLNVARRSMMIWEYTWSIILSILSGFIIWKLSREEIKILFN